MEPPTSGARRSYDARLLVQTESMREPEFPPRHATDAFLSRNGRRLAVAFDVDLGELVEGRRVIARGIERGGAGAELHYEFVPGISDSEWAVPEPFFWYWMLHASDDRGTVYSDDNGGGFDQAGGPAAHGLRDLGNVIPPEARLLTIDFEPPKPWSGWSPRSSYVRRLVIDLGEGCIAEVVRSR
jgi:hypothetical protein